MERFRSIEISQLYFKIMWLFALMLYIFIPLGSILLSLIYKGIVLITFGCFICLQLVSKKYSACPFDRVSMLVFILLVLAVSVSFILGTGRISFDKQIMGILGFLEMPIAIIMMDSVAYNKENFRFVLHVNVVIALVFVALSFSPYAYSGELHSLYLGYSNPNTTGIFLLLNQAILLMSIPSIRKRFAQACVMGVGLYELYLIYLTDSRTCLAVSLIIGLYYLLGKRVKIPNWIISVAMLVPLAFLFIYTGLYASGKYHDLYVLGKEFYSGREKYFLEQVRALSDNLWIGDVRKRYFTNMHNVPLTIIASCGIVGYVLFFIFNARTIYRYAVNANSQIQYIALFAIMGVFIHSSAEAALFVGGAHYSIIIATFFWILKGNAYEYNS